MRVLNFSLIHLVFETETIEVIFFKKTVIEGDYN